jgi:hypothetical protein
MSTNGRSIGIAVILAACLTLCSSGAVRGQQTIDFDFTGEGFG